MRGTDVLVAHHEELRSLMARLAEIPRGAPGERRRTLDALMTELALHEQIEDELFYPAMRNVSALVTIAHSEHRLLDDQLAAVLRADPAGTRFDEEFRALRAAVEHHAGKEESEMFPEVVAKVDEAELGRIGDRLAARLQELRGSALTGFRLRVKRAVVRRL